MLEFLVGYLVGAQSAQPSTPLTWRSFAKGLIALSVLVSAGWFVWSVLSAGGHADDCGGSAVARAWCEAAAGLGSFLFVVGAASVIVVLFVCILNALRAGE